ncbi:MAG: AAA family ATPase, partial [Planctomycetota bacterium]
QTLARLANTKIAAIDTEHGALSKYQGYTFDGMPPVDFDTCQLQHFAPTAYTAAIREAAAAGYGVLLIDSLSHAWSGVGGALAQVDQKSAGGGSSFTAWKDVTPQHNELVEAILSYPGHVLASMRTKMEYVLEEEDRKGRKVMVPKKIGMKPVQREGMDYEFDIVCDLDEAHTLIVGKTRCPAIDGQRVVKPGPEFLAPVVRWLDEGIDSLPVPTFAPSAGGTADAIVTASDLQISEIQVACQTLELNGQPSAMLAKRGVQEIRELSHTQAEEILISLRSKLAAKRKELDERLAEADKDAKTTNAFNEVKPVVSDTTAPNSLTPVDNAAPPAAIMPEDPNRVGSIDSMDEKKIIAGCHKLQIGDADLGRILAKRQTEAGTVVRCVQDLSFNQGKEMLANIEANVAKRFGDKPF